MGRVIQALPTRYAGTEFRSRQEARWAVILDALGVAWVYEPEGVLVGGEGYVPDFYLPEWGAFAEVKGAMDQFTEKAQRKANGLGGLTGRPVLVLAEINPYAQEVPCIVVDPLVGPETWACPLGRSALKGKLWLDECAPLWDESPGADEFCSAADFARNVKFDRVAA
jgi:hypothetical protein